MNNQILTPSSTVLTLSNPSKYYGRNEIVLKDNPTHKQTLENILILVEDISKTILSKSSAAGHKEQWDDLLNGLESLTEQLMNDNILVEKFRFEIINEVVIPYMNEMKSPRVSLDKARFDQVKVGFS